MVNCRSHDNANVVIHYYLGFRLSRSAGHKLVGLMDIDNRLPVSLSETEVLEGNDRVLD
jgi:hypothetical protein